VSKYLELKAHIEELTAQLETTRIAEMEAEVTDIKKRIIAFGIRPEQLYGAEELKAHRPKGPARVRREPKYAYGGKTWSGEGEKPAWFRKAIKEHGQTEASMLIGNVNGAAQ
jgi:DNA-binding protein H-NS